MSTIKEVAKEAGVSIAAVSYALNGTGNVSEETKNRIMQAVKKLNYLPNENARNLRKRRKTSIGLFLKDFVVGFYGVLLESAVAACVKNNIDFHLYIIPETGDVLTDKILSADVGGMIILHEDFSNNCIERLKSKNVPIVFLDREIQDDNISSVLTANAAGIVSVIDYLVKNGHRRILFMRGNGCYDDQKRFEGYLNAISKYGIPANLSSVINGQYTEYGGYYGFLEAYKKDGLLPDAICCSNDSMALGCIHALKDCGFSVPQDISVTGFDGYFTKPEDIYLTSVYNPGDQLAKVAVGEICRLFDKEEKGRLTFVDTKLVIRDSTKYCV